MAAKVLNLKWSTGNSKLKKTGTISFNLPAFKSADGFKVCPMAGLCAGLCYAQQGRIAASFAQKPREENLAAVRGDLTTFVSNAIADLGRFRNTSVRVHDSGDFFSQDYLNAWAAIAQAVPSKKFYAYTKSMHLDFSVLPANFQIVQSMGGLMDSAIDTSKSHAKIFASHEDREAAGYVNGNLNDGPAIAGDRAIGLVYHGVRNLTSGQAIRLRAV